MPRSELLRSTAFRLAIVFSGLFLLAFGVAGFLAYRIIVTDLNDRLDRTLLETFDMISRSYTDGDVEDLIGTVQTYSAESQQHQRVFYLADPSGKLIAGNVTTAIANSGLTTVSSQAFALPGDGDFRTRRGMVAGNELVVAISLDETEEFAGLVLTSFAWAAALAVAIAVAAGLAIASAVRRRMNAIAGTMDQVGQGELAARIPLRGSNDDLDVLSGQINTALDRLAALVEGMRQVSVDIAHDLKTPLNRLSIIIEDALEKSELGQANTDDLLAAQLEAGRINDTFEALLRIAQLESGARRERFVDVSIGEVLAVLLEAYEDVALENGQTLTITGPQDNPCNIRGDRDLLTQLFANLIENAIRHAEGGSSITVDIQSHHGVVTVRVADNGPGIPAVERDKVFRRLYRLEKSRTTEGTGLGLSMVKAIADLHGATIGLADALPGLSVTLSFPAITGQIGA
ncbi:MAG: HAMP domain-containing histidine kinase [Alphaproteobacteria bacterium]|nr:HAMP domain-containing histidine kinase [Alphaproteobacteria bacterium]